MAVVIGCVFLALVANAFGLFKFGKKNHTVTPVKQEQRRVNQNRKQTESQSQFRRYSGCLRQMPKSS